MMLGVGLLRSIHHGSAVIIFEIRELEKLEAKRR